MGGSSSKMIQETAQYCKYNKKDFAQRIEVVRDAHTVMQYFASLLLSKQSMPMQLSNYPNYGDAAEDYFNSKRKQEMSDLTAINPKITSYYAFYSALGNLQGEYEKPEMTEETRRGKIEQVFNLSYTILKLLIEELLQSCDDQGVPSR